MLLVLFRCPIFSEGLNLVAILKSNSSVQFYLQKGDDMNRDQIRGSFKDTTGRIQKKFGQLFGSKRHEGSGVVTQAEGKTQKTAGDASDNLEKAKENVKDTLKR